MNKVRFKILIIIWTILIIDLCLLINLVGRSRLDSSQTFSEIRSEVLKALDFKGLSLLFKKIAEDEGGAYGYRALAYAAQNYYLPSNIDAHLLGHVVGDVLYEQEGINGMKYCTDDLRNACSHSIVVGAFLELGRSAVTQAAGICKDAPGGRGAYSMCVHGLGHGVLASAEYDFDKAIELCRDLDGDNFKNREYVECVGGATMEMMAGIHDRDQWEKQKIKFLPDSDPLAPCNRSSVGDEVKSICYTYLTPRLFQVAGADLGRPTSDDFKKAFKYCEKIPVTSVGDRQACFGGFGKEFVVLANSRNVQSIDKMSQDQLKLIYSWCYLTDNKSGRSDCIRTALYSLYWGGENDYHISINYCSILEGQEEKDNCFKELLNLATIYNVNAKINSKFCEDLPSEFKENCVKRLNNESRENL